MCGWTCVREAQTLKWLTWILIGYLTVLFKYIYILGRKWLAILGWRLQANWSIKARGSSKSLVADCILFKPTRYGVSIWPSCLQQCLQHYSVCSSPSWATDKMAKNAKHQVVEWFWFWTFYIADYTTGFPEKKCTRCILRYWGMMMPLMSCHNYIVAQKCC